EPDDTTYVVVVLHSGGGSGSVVPPTSTTTGWSERWGSRQRGWRLRRTVLVWVADAPRRSGRRRCPLPQGDRRHRPDQDGQAPPSRQQDERGADTGQPNSDHAHDIGGIGLEPVRRATVVALGAQPPLIVHADHAVTHPPTGSSGAIDDQIRRPPRRE